MFCYYYLSYVVWSVYESSKMVVAATYGCNPLQMILKLILIQALKDVKRKLKGVNPPCKNVGYMKVGNQILNVAS